MPDVIRHARLTVRGMRLDAASGHPFVTDERLDLRPVEVAAVSGKIEGTPSVNKIDSENERAAAGGDVLHRTKKKLAVKTSTVPAERIRRKLFTICATERFSYGNVSHARVFAVTIRQAYSVLGLDASSTTPDEIRLRFRELIRLNHPDGRPSHEQAGANERTRAIVEACSLLRTQELLRETSARRSSADAGFRRRAETSQEPTFAEVFGWIDELWRECLSGNLVYAASPAFGLRVTLGAWAIGWELMWGAGSSVNRSVCKPLE
jgi:hypothetical protein